MAALTEAIRCTLPNCRCECFSPGKSHTRTCDTCKHGWVAHALDKLGYRSMYQLGMQVEVVQPNIVFDIASLMLYGAQATPIRLKILLDRLFSVLQHEEVIQVLHGFGWSYEDYARGYILQDATGRVLDKWIVATRDEEQVILQQFLRFGETKSIAQEIILQDTRENRERQIINTPKTESEIKKFIERSNLSMQSYLRNYEAINRLNRQMAQQYAAPTSSASSTPRILSPSSGIPSYSPPSSREAVNLTITGASSPVSGSPLSRLQTMQPFDYRRDHVSPTVSPVASEKSLAPSCGSKSPENLSMSSTTTTTPPAPSITPTSISVMSVIKAEDDMKYVTAPSSDDSNDEAINYSLKNNNNNDTDTTSSVYADRKIKHLRKSANPMKRQWQPSAAFGTTFISPSGKKRVLCTACNKTFCDKGALKIHYSAVHLKEMHKCTVEGCNMMFSSRRSRNRHSANPNPKLHMPNAKRKLPEGATILDDKPPPNLPTSLPGVPPPTISISQLASLPMSTISPEMKQIIPKMEVMPLNHDAPMLTEQRYYLDHTGQVAIYSSPTKMPKLDDSCDSLPPTSPAPPAMGLTLPVQIKLESDACPEPAASSRSSRKRKSMVPTRCAQPTDESFVMSDENSNDGIMPDAHADADMPENLCMKPQDLSSKKAGEEKPEEKKKEDECTDDCCNQEEGCEEDRLNCQKKVTRSSFREIQQKAIKHMDSISQAQLRDVCLDGCDKSDSGAEENGCMDVSMESNGMANNGHAEINDIDHSADEMNCKDGHLSDAESNCSNDSHDGTNGKDDDSDIPLDKENPKKCPACSKMFQNHFGVKTHYQNVHLKLMHTCTVEGCNAAFPSKRSRDRHSSNLNLHRKLLSTTSSDGEKTPTKNLLSQNLREEFLPRIYDSHHYNNALTLRFDREEENNHANLAGITTATNNHPSTNDRPASPAFNGDSLGEDQAYFGDLENGGEGHEDGDSPQPDPDGMVRCHICKQRFRDNLVMKEHYEKVHPKEMYRCTVSGCDKIFSTRKSRNRHSQNDNLHRHISPTKTNGTS